MVKCPKCGEEIKSLVLDVVELVRYKEVVFDDSGRLVLSPEREIYDRRQYMYRCPRCKKLITYASQKRLTSALSCDVLYFSFGGKNEDGSEDYRRKCRRTHNNACRTHIPHTRMGH